MRTIIVLVSYHHKNTEKLAKAIAKVLDAIIVSPEEIGPNELANYDLVGFGSGVYGAKHHSSILKLAKKLPVLKDKNAFLFSTTGSPEIGINDEFIRKNHETLRHILGSKGYRIVGEFGCPGHNTNFFLKFFGGLNRGRPNEKDLKDAEKFALEMVRKNSHRPIS